MTYTPPEQTSEFVDPFGSAPVFRQPKGAITCHQMGKVDPVKMEEFLSAGRSQAWIARYFGVSRASISQRISRTRDPKSFNEIRAAKATKDPGKIKAAKAARDARAVRTVTAVAKAPLVIESEIDTINQLARINATANQLLDEQWIDEAVLGDDGSPQRDENGAVMTRRRMQRPDIGLKIMAEIRSQLELQIKIYEKLYETKAVKAYQDAVMGVLNNVDPALKSKVILELKRKNALRAALDVNK